MFKTREQLILASGSPRRQQFFEELGLDFMVCPAHIDETRRTGEEPESYVKRLALEKADEVSMHWGDAWVVAADTIVSIGSDLLGKPRSEDDAVDLLMMLSGQEHEVRTGYCVCSKRKGICDVEAELTRVQFSVFTEEIARIYVMTGESMDKAGAYGIQGKGGMLVEAVNGSYSNVVGLPVAQLVSRLMEHQVIVPDV